MRPANSPSSWFAWERVIPIGVVAIGLFAASFLSDMYLERIGVPLTATIINNVVIGVLAGAGLLAYEIKMSRDQEFRRTKERIAMIAELNSSVRHSLTAIGLSAGLEQRDERLRRIDEAMARIDTVLNDLLQQATSDHSRAPVASRRPAGSTVTPVPEQPSDSAARAR